MTEEQLAQVERLPAIADVRRLLVEVRALQAERDELKERLVAVREALIQAAGLLSHSTHLHVNGYSSGCTRCVIQRDVKAYNDALGAG